MKTVIAGCLALTTAAFTLSSAAVADPAWCGKRVSATGHANFQEARPERLACHRARTKWSAKVRAGCKRSSPWWWRARSKKTDQDAGAGQRWCNVSAIPARRIF